MVDTGEVVADVEIGGDVAVAVVVVADVESFQFLTLLILH